MDRTDDAHAEVVELERRFWVEGGGSPPFWREHFADAGRVALPFGILDKPQTVEAMAQGRPWADVAMDELAVVALTDDTVLVTYRATATRPGEADPYTAVVGSVYVREGERWRLAFHQQSPAGD